MRSKNMDILKDYFSNKSVLLGWTGGASFFSSASLESQLGVVVSAIMIISSIAMQYYKIQAIKNEERRKEELHEIAIEQQKKRDQDG